MHYRSVHLLFYYLSFLLSLHKSICRFLPYQIRYDVTIDDKLHSIDDANYILLWEINSFTYSSVIFHKWQWKIVKKRMIYLPLYFMETMTINHELVTDVHAIGQVASVSSFIFKCYFCHSIISLNLGREKERRENDKQILIMIKHLLFGLFMDGMMIYSNNNWGYVLKSFMNWKKQYYIWPREAYMHLGVVDLLLH